MSFLCFFFFKRMTAYDIRISDWSSDVCPSDLLLLLREAVVLLTQRIGGKARAVGFVGGQALDAVDAVGGGGGALVRREVADETGAAAWNGLAPVARKIGKASCRERVCQYV